jgi:hypothetical protein
MSNFKSLAIAGTILLLSAFFPTPTAKAQYVQDTAQLLNYGNQYYGKNCVTSSKYYFAYMQRQQGLSAADTNLIRQRIRDCESQEGVFAGTDGKYDMQGMSPEAQAKIKRCGDYAVLAMTAARINQRAQCGNGGNRWLTDYGSHYSWCMDANPSAQELRSESSARSNALNGCLFK